MINKTNSANKTNMQTIELKGLIAAPAQVRGAFRLVPLLREQPCDDVRITPNTMSAGIKVVDLPDQTQYMAFVPHALMLEWATADKPLVALGGQIKQGVNLARSKQSKQPKQPKQSQDWRTVEHVDKLRKKEGRQSLRFLPLHLALEGLLALHFAPPSIAWPELSRDMLRFGLGSRSESGVMGRWLAGFEDALRTFELHRGQVGMLIYVADQLAAAFVVPSAQDYRRLHRSVLEDLYGELVWRYAVLYPETPVLQGSYNFSHAQTVADLQLGLKQMRADWASFVKQEMLSDLLGMPLMTQQVYQAGTLKLDRFITDLKSSQVNHIGERLTRQNGEVLYLKTFQLSAAQTRRAGLLDHLAKHEWHLAKAAAALGITQPQLVGRVLDAGFGYLLSQTTKEQAAKALHR